MEEVQDEQERPLPVPASATLTGLTSRYRSEQQYSNATLGAVDGVDGLLPAGVLLGSGGQAVLLIQVELEPHGQSIQLPLLDDR